MQGLLLEVLTQIKENNNINKQLCLKQLKNF